VLAIPIIIFIWKYRYKIYGCEYASDSPKMEEEHFLLAPPRGFHLAFPRRLAALEAVTGLITADLQKRQ
jgi:hypothetical protein